MDYLLNLIIMKEQNWRFIYTGKNDPYFNMALDEVLLHSVQKGCPPVLRLYQWDPATISIGYFQEVEKVVDLDKCNRSGIKLVRRITGGRAVLHNEELTYSFCGSSKDFPGLGKNVAETYQTISTALLVSLKALGIEAQWVKPPRKERNIKNSFAVKRDRLYKNKLFDLPCFSSFSRYEISFQGKKLIGSAQRRFGNYFLQHGSILLKKEDLRLTYFLPKDNSFKKIYVEENSTSLGEIRGGEVSYLEIIRSLKQGFGRFFKKDFDESLSNPNELKNTQRLIEEKYSKDEWNLKF
ncbi:MAG: lipoate--protein ligase family protein [candidate division Zixibacteria bacterium]|nr:lipoate--protein ligase family protein [candidate division Zixibacteria bacterium]